MKNVSLTIATLIALSLSITSCNKNKDEDNVTPQTETTTTNHGNGTVTDTTGTTTDTTVTTTDPVNTAPVAVADNIETEEGESITFNVLTNDTDAENHVLSVVGNTTTSNGTVTDNGNGGFIFVPASGFVGTTSFTYTLKDSETKSTDTEVTGTVNIEVTKKVVVKTAAQISTENLLENNKKVEIYNIDGLNVSKYFITFDTDNKTVSVNFIENSTVSFRMNNNVTPTYTINSLGYIVLPNVTYSVTTIQDNVEAIIFESQTSTSINKKFTTINPNNL